MYVHRVGNTPSAERQGISECRGYVVRTPVSANVYCVYALINRNWHRVSHGDLHCAIRLGIVNEF